MVRTIEEVAERLKKKMEENEGMFSLWWEFSGKILAVFLPKEKLEELGFKVKEGYEPHPLTEEEIMKQMREYFEFAVEKCTGCRGISASRTIEHYKEWIWLLGDDEFLQEIENMEYAPYGKPILIAIAKRYGFDKEFPEAFKELEEFDDEWC